MYAPNDMGYELNIKQKHEEREEMVEKIYQTPKKYQ